MRGTRFLNNDVGGCEGGEPSKRDVDGVRRRSTQLATYSYAHFHVGKKSIFPLQYSHTGYVSNRHQAIIVIIMSYPASSTSSTRASTPRPDDLIRRPFYCVS
jgi:hypothetical protein